MEQKFFTLHYFPRLNVATASDRRRSLSEQSFPRFNVATASDRQRSVSEQSFPRLNVATASDRQRSLSEPSQASFDNCLSPTNYRIYALLFQKIPWWCAQPSSNKFEKSAHTTKDACRQALHKLLSGLRASSAKPQAQAEVSPEHLRSARN